MRASRVEVHERIDEPTTFTLRYPVGIVAQDLPLLLDARIGPESELSVVRPIEGVNHILVKGPVRGQNIRLSHGGGGDSWVEVVGVDATIQMDREIKRKSWADTSASDAVSSIVSDYGFDADVESTPAKHPEAKHGLVQRDTDLRFVRKLAERHGFLFWLTYEDKKKPVAHFRRPQLDGKPALVLKINKTPPDIGWIDIAWDVEKPTSAVAAQHDMVSNGDLDGAVQQSPLTALGTLAFNAVAPAVRTVQIVAPADEAGDLKARSEGALIEAGWFTRACCQTGFHLTGALIRPHTVVELAGAGTRHSGKYFVAGVRHVIETTGHVMELELYRNAWSA
jgi:phage protein D